MTKNGNDLSCKTIYAKNGFVLAIFPTKTPPAGNTLILTRHVTL